MARRPWLAGAALVALVMVAYLPALRAGWVWDDDYYITKNPTLGSVEGLRRIWLEIGAVPQYYPLVHTTFWVEHRLWGLRPMGYHLDNVLLHALGAVLLWRVLVLLEVPGAWVAAAVFAVHPMHAESVAWVTERKNVLSSVFYLASGLVYVRAALGKPTAVPWGMYLLSLALFVAALLSKTVTCSLPAAILLILWWKRGRITMRDVTPLLPFLVIGVGAAILTGWMEKHVVGAQGAEWQISFPERCIIAGRAVWFYAGRLVFPWPLMFVYPRWEVGWNDWALYIFPISAVAVVIGLVLARHRMGRGPATAALFFCGTLFPALGFINTLPMRYSFVADHFVYLASVGVIATAAVVLKRAPIAAAVILIFMALTWQRCYAFRDAEMLWRDTLAKNPSAWMAQHNLGNLLLDRGELDAAEARFREAIRLKPDHVEARVSLGMVAEKRGQLDVAEQWYRQAQGIDPRDLLSAYNLQRLARLYNNLGAKLASEGKLDDAQRAFRLAIRADEGYSDAQLNLGITLEKQGKVDEARIAYEAALKADPSSVRAKQRLGQLSR